MVRGVLATRAIAAHSRSQGSSGRMPSAHCRHNSESVRPFSRMWDSPFEVLSCESPQVDQTPNTLPSVSKAGPKWFSSKLSGS
eukprot:4966861-Amphidinium_carterae.1